MRIPGISLAMGNRLTLRYSRVSGSLPRIELAGLEVCISKYSRLSAQPNEDQSTCEEAGRINQAGQSELDRHQLWPVSTSASAGTAGCPQPGPINVRVRNGNFERANQNWRRGALAKSGMVGIVGFRGVHVSSVFPSALCSKLLAATVQPLGRQGKGDPVVQATGIPVSDEEL